MMNKTKPKAQNFAFIERYSITNMNRCVHTNNYLQNNEENIYTLQQYVKKNNKQPIVLMQRKRKQYCVLVELGTNKNAQHLVDIVTATPECTPLPTHTPKGPKI